MSARLQQIMGRIHGPLTAHFAKRGAVVPNLFDSPTKRQLLEWRNDARREINDLQARAASQERTDSITLLGQWVGALQEAIDALEQLEGAEPVNENSTRAKRSKATWTTRDGRPVVALTAATMRDREATRSALSAFGGRFEARSEDDDVTAADFLRAVAGMQSSEPAKRALASGTGAGGGFTVPGTVLADILAALAPASTLISAGAQTLVLDELSNSFRWAAVNTLPTPAWRNEGAAVAESDPVFRNVDFTPRSLSVLFRVSRELLMDSPVLQDAIPRIIGQAMAVELDRVGLRGTGTAPQPRGILNTSGIQSVTNGANGASLGTTAYANLISAMQAIRTANGPMPTAAIMAPRSLATLAGLLDTTNQPRQVPPLLSGWQMLDTSQIPINLTVGTGTDCSEIYVADFRTVAFGVRHNVQVQQLNERYAETGEIGFVAHMRVDFACLYPAAVGVVTGVRA
jgi:HK97 family phage major capsid protein